MDIIFDTPSHTYTNKITDEKYISVTTLISQFKDPFDKDKWSKIVADKKGTTQDKILGLWETITKNAQERGTKYHKIMEDYIKDGVILEEYKNVITSFAQKIKGINDDDTAVESEKLLYNHNYKIAGTADLVLTNSKGFHIFDFKTNKKINFYNKYNTFFKEPIDHLMQCEYNTYAIQLSMYAFMLEELIQLPCLSLRLFYLREFQDKTFWQEMNTPYMKDSVKNLLDFYKKTLKY
jgi:ATP-dependent exoDNAse (exonuclease V) beta subunit